jgi:lipase chaperone LimK
MSGRWSWLSASLALALALAGWLAFAPTAPVKRAAASASESAPADAVATVAPPAQPRAAATIAAAAAPASVAPAPSLRGTEVDGALERDSSGAFVATPRALQLFDYFLTASGEEDAATIRAQVVAAARQRLPGQEVDRALSLYDRYVDYRARLQDAFARAPLGGGPRAALAIAEATQVDVFGRNDAARLFSADNTLAEVMLARTELATADLDPGARAAQATALEQRLPEPMRRARAGRAEIAANLQPAP